MSLNFAGQNLHGRSFKGQNLSGADFSHANLQGADFTTATLTDADFSHANLKGTRFAQATLQRSQFIYAITGLQRVQEIVLSGSCLFATSLAGLGAGLAGSWISNLLLSDNTLLKFGDTNGGNFHSTAAGLLALVVLITSFAVMLAQGLRSAFQIGGITAIVAGVITTTTVALKTGVGNSSGEIAVAVDGAAAVAVILAVAPVLIVALSATVLESLILPGVAAVLGIMASVKLGIASKVADWVLISTWAGGSVLILLGLYVGQCILSKKHGYERIKSLAVGLTVSNGTHFRGSDLTEANFSYATLKHSDFRQTIIARTLWHGVRHIDWTRVGDTILVYPAVCDLLVSGDGSGKSYANANFQGANLIGADLRHANFNAADLSGANLQGACLEWASLTQAQAIGADFTNAKMTGACGLGTWNIDGSTVLDKIDCRWVYLLEQPKPGTDDRERRPSSGEFAPEEFTSLFRKVIDTVDLIFRNGIDWRAFTQSFQQIQVEHTDTHLEIQSIENKSNGIVVVKVRTSTGADKGTIHSQFMQFYQDEIAIAHQQNKVLHKHEQEIQFMREMINRLIERPVLDQVVILHVGKEAIENGFSVTLQILQDGIPLPSVQCIGELPPNNQIFSSYNYWQSAYRRSLKSTRLDVPSQVTNVSGDEFFSDCLEAATNLSKQINLWLSSESFRPVDQAMRTQLNCSQPIRIILQTDHPKLRQLPWQTWRFFDDYPQAELALSKSTYRSPTLTVVATPKAANAPVKILAVVGDSRGIDLAKDQATLAASDAEVTPLITPQRQDISAALWEQPWDILFFAGHSRSQAEATTGELWINAEQHLLITDIRNALTQAISRGLKLAIFNSCDGLGLANNLADLQIPQMIVMREPIPDAVAHSFLINFLTGFSSGKSLYQSVREARERLQDIEDQYPCATWMPVIVQNPTELPPTWQNLKNG